MIVRGLARQITAEIQCMRPGSLENVADMPGIRLGDAAAAVPYLRSEAAAALREVVSGEASTLPITSAMRTIPQQYLLRSWAERDRCGIALAAPPGRSNHEDGLAVDVPRGSADAWRSRLEAAGFASLAGDAVHFDYPDAGGFGNLPVRAFQRLWNRNHPDDRIAEDGLWGSQTRLRLQRSPAEGFPVGAGCDSPSEPVDDTDDADDDEPLSEGDAEGGGSSEPGADLGCETGTDCADCNAIDHNCGFCASSGECMAGDGSGPWSGSCASDWQWIPPETCPTSGSSGTDDGADDGADEPEDDGDAEPEWCAEVRGGCEADTDCCTGLSCRRGVSFSRRCCAEAGTACTGGGDCCGYMDCVDGSCRCRSAGRACLEDADCCSSDCRSGRCE